MDVSVTSRAANPGKPASWLDMPSKEVVRANVRAAGSIAR